MVEGDGFKFACPHCEQPLEAAYDMVGMSFECPACGQKLTVPAIEHVPDDLSGDGASVGSQTPPVITVIKRRERFADRCKKRLKAIGIGVLILLLFIGVGIAKAVFDEADAVVSENVKSITETGAKAKAVEASIECLLNFIDLPNERRLQVLSRSLELCPEDFRDAVKGFLVSVSKTSDDMISDQEREEMVKGRALLGLLFGAANQGDPRSGVATGLQLGDLICAEAQKEANRRLRKDVESKLNRLIDVAQKYGVDPTRLENALIGRLR